MSLQSSPVKSRPPLRVRMIFGTHDNRNVAFEIELYAQHAPKTVENFVALCEGFTPPKEEGNTDAPRPPTRLAGTLVHRVTPGRLIEAGKTWKEENESVFGKTFQEKEALDWRQLDESGLVCMANSGDCLMSSRFFIILKERGMPRLSGRYVCFGKVVKGLERLVQFTLCIPPELAFDDDEVPSRKCFILIRRIDIFKS